MSESAPVVVVTGASRGIGSAIAKRLGASGNLVVVNYLNGEEEANAVVSEILAANGQALAIQANVGLAEDVKRLFKEAKGLGPLIGLVNNAGITRDKAFLRMTEAEWDEVMLTNLKSMFLCTKAAASIMMLAKTGGSVVNMSSVVGLIGNPFQTNYAAAKAGVIGFTKSLAKELGELNIRVNAVAPGFIETRLTDILPQEYKDKLVARTPLGKFGVPDDIAGVVEFLVSSNAGFVTGHVLTADGGLSMA